MTDNSSMLRAAPPQEGRGSLSGRWTMWFAAGLLIAYAVLIFAQRRPPSLTDYANWTYQGALVHRHLVGGPDPAHLLKQYPVPNSAVSALIGVLNLLMPWNMAAKAWLCLYLLTAFAVTRHMMRTTCANGLLWLIVPAATYLNLNLWYGFVSFQLGLCWVVLFASMLLRKAEYGSAVRDRTLGVMLLLAFFTHMIPFAFCCLMLALFARQTRRYAVLWQSVPGLLVSGWYVLGRYLLANHAEETGIPSSVRDYSVAFWAYKANSYLKSFGMVNPFDRGVSQSLALFGDGGWLLLFVLNAALCVSMGWCFVSATRAAWREQSAERFLWLSVMLVLPVYLLLPGTAFSVSDPGSRVLQSALALAVMLCGRQRGSWALRTAAVCAAVIGLAGVTLFSRVILKPDAGPQVVSRLPGVLAQFGHVSFRSADPLYDSLEREDFTRPVFPTAMLLNVPDADAAKPQSHGKP